MTNIKENYDKGFNFQYRKKCCLIIFAGLIVVFNAFFLLTFNPITGVSTIWQRILKINISEGENYYRIISNSLINIEAPVTDAKLTKRFIQNREYLRTGGLVHLILETYNNKGTRQTQGGDLFFAVMGNGNKTRSKWTAGKINDYGNGTYSINFHAGWSGPAHISIIMVHPREAVFWIKHVYRPIEGRTLFNGTFVEGSRQETSLCTIIREGSRKGKCIYQNPLALGKTTPVCDKPPNLPCNSLKFTKSITWYNFLKETLNKTHANYLFNSSNFHVDTGPMQLYIKEDKTRVSNITKSLPKCNKGLAEPPSEGFWLGNSWNSLACEAEHSLEKTDVLNCIKKRKIYLLGDSTSRQWFAQLSGYVGRTSSPSLRGIQENKTLNITLTFQFHPWVISSRKTDLTQERYASDVINSLTDPSCDYILVVSPWAHFAGWTQESYEEMLVLIRSAMHRLKERCPDTIIVIKGTHAREHGGKLDNIGSSDWLLYDMNQLIRKIFSEIDAIFIDVWDMNLSYPSRNVIHMPSQVVRQGIKLFLSYICPS